MTFTLERRLSKGKYGVVHCARSSVTNDLVAIKFVVDSSAHAHRMRVEVRALERLKGVKHVVGIRECFYDANSFICLVMDYAELGSLTSILDARRDPLCEADARNVFYQMLLGLQACHACGIIHHDISPNNVLVSRCGTVRLCDFGFAEFFDPQRPDDVRIVSCNTTPLCAAPEILAQVGHGPSVDVWSAGVVLFLCLAQQYPFDTNRFKQLLDFVLGPVTDGGARDETRALQPVLPGKIQLRGDVQGLLDTIFKPRASRWQQRATVRALLAHPWLQTASVSVRLC